METKNVRSLREKLIEAGIKSRTGKYFGRSNLYAILSNKVYIGKIVHKDKVYEGQHESIVPIELFNQVQNILDANLQCKRHHTNTKNGCLLAGLLYDDKKNRMTTTFSNGSKRYRYYVSMAVTKAGEYEKGDITKIAAGEIEKYVQDDFTKLLKNQHFMQNYLKEYSIEEQTNILNKMQTFEPDKVFTRTAIERVDLKTDEIKISYNITYIVKYFATLAFNAKFDYNKNDAEVIERKQDVRILQIPQRQNKIIIQGERNYDMNLIQALIKSFWYNKLGAERRLPPKARNGNNKRLRKLRFLPPEIIESIMNGTQDPELNVKKLIEMANKCVK